MILQYPTFLSHHGIEGQEWGDRNGPPYPLKPSAYSAKERRADDKWHRKHVKTTGKKLEKTIQKSQGMKNYDKQLREAYKEKGISVKNKNGSLNKNYIADYNRKMAEVANSYVKSIGGMTSPSGQMAIAFVAKRGEIGIHTAMASVGADLSAWEKGVFANGKAAYNSSYAEVQDYDR